MGTTNKKQTKMREYLYKDREMFPNVLVSIFAKSNEEADGILDDMGLDGDYFQNIGSEEKL